MGEIRVSLRTRLLLLLLLLLKTKLEGACD